jgi:hypothetical protein
LLLLLLLLLPVRRESIATTRKIGPKALAPSLDPFMELRSLLELLRVIWLEEMFGSKKFKSIFFSPLRTTDSAFLDKMFSSNRPSKKPGMSLSAKIFSEGRGKEEGSSEKVRCEM